MSTIKWNLDPVHSEVTFKVKHMMITSVTGHFRDYAVTALTEREDFSKANVAFTGKLNSLTTGNEQRDAHLRSADFFDAENHNDVTFKSTSFEKDGNDYSLTGELTIKGITRPVTLNVEFGGIQKDPWGNTKAGFSVSGKINRRDFGLNWNAALETGGVLVGDDVKIASEIQLIRAA
jgi:polyisoprenoid-binding protein YceI